MKRSQHLLSHLIIGMCLIGSGLLAQTNSSDKKVSESNKVYQTSKKINEKSAEIKENTENTIEQVKQASGQIKSVIKIFEPILKIHLVKPSLSNTEVNSIKDDNPEPPPAVNQEPTEGQTELMTDGSADDHRYNPDGSANWGCQHHKEYGCYLDLSTGTIMDDIDVAGNTSAVDVIFTATDYFGSAPMYALLSPSLVKNDLFANYYFRGPAYKDQNIPVRLWEDVNESEIALTNLSSLQFDKIKNNDQLSAVIKQTPGFKDRLESRSKLSGKVIAVKTKMGNRNVYGLIQILDQFGTTGTNAFLKVKIKISGFDSNGDGIPDPALYRQSE